MNFYTQLWRQFMRITFLLISISVTIGLVSVQAGELKAQALGTPVDISFGKEDLSSAIKKLEKKTNVSFAYDEDYLKLNDKYTSPAKFTNQPLQDILTVIFKNQGIGFKEQAGNITLFKQASGKLTGKITDDRGEALPGATVRVAGTNLGDISNSLGMYNIAIPEGTYTIEVTFIGYNKLESKNVTITGNQTSVLNLSMTGGSMLKEVVVSYGKQRAREISGSISQVDASQLQDMPVMQFAQQLQGKAAGVQIAQSSGQPGRGVEFRIRGAASFYASNQPLFVIDGIPVTGSINNINPSEIESYSILKDASATALYGSRAANGVVLITTKHAKPGESKIEFNSSYGIQKIPGNRVPKMMDAHGFAQYMNEKFADSRKYEPGFTTATPADYLDPNQYGKGTDWFKLLTRTAPIQNYDLTIQTAREKSTSTVIAGYQEQQGVLINTGTKLFSLRINQDLTLSNNKLKIGFSVAPSYRLDHNNRLTTDGVGGLFERIFEASPLKSPYNADGTYNRDTYSPGMVAYINPLAQFKLTNDDYKTTRILANAYLNYEFLKGLSLKTNVAVDKGSESRQYFQSGVVASNVGQATGLSSFADNGSYTAETNLDYHKSFGDHNLEVLAGYSAQKYSGTNNSITGLGFPSDDIPYISAATSISAFGGGYSAYSLLSGIARVNYNYKGKYLLQGAVRRDGSSRFGENQKYGTFPSVSAGWVISDEKFMNRFTFIDLLKLRASYGVTGNNFFGNYDALATTAKYYYAFAGALAAGQTINRLQNDELRWERNKQFDIGFDLSLFNNRLNITYDYYHKISDGLIMQRPIPKASGFTSILDNVGVLELWGHEFSVNSTNLTGKFKWNTSFNISFDRNIIKDLVSPGYIRRNNTVSSDYFRQQEGHHLGEFYGFVFLGLYKDANDLANSAQYGKASDVGTIKVKDINGDGVIDDVNDRTFIGDPTPTFTGGITNNFSYKNFDLNINMAFSVGGQLLNAAKWAYQTNLDGSRVMLAAAADRWRSPDDPGSGIYPRTKTGTTAMGRQVNSQWVENGSYLTAKNISLGYRINMPEKSMIRNIRVYGSVQQAFVITGYSGMNPEINFAGLDPTLGIGVDENAYPIPRTFSLGLSATFK
ncbi:SusC/RagA family TonB-linked outer membrane protein [Mucilaginibacter kameinonensis]|uniref:SusC/RagA family TonB-linked outer membrane protein n=1 Tax=Mucilaginibacter kameinonensis TaxID=452286 RepID=UPI001FC9C233|nr:SusC/RagA family TonB-linked outer membrane protein [Mucilaginibacter kameinonensis]